MLAGLALALVACGGDGEETTVVDGTGPPASAPVPSGSVDDVPEGEGLAVRLRGVVDGERVCPGGARPCVPVEGDVEVDGDGQVVLVGRLLDGRLVLDRQEPIPPFPWRRPDDCEAAPSSREHGTHDSAFDQWQRRTVEYATSWISPTGTLHVGVVGDAAPHEAAFDELGIGDEICVVGGFARSDVELREVVDVGLPVFRRLAEESGNGSMSASADAFLGAVVVELLRVDRPMVEEVELAYGDLVVLRAPVEVLDGTLDEYDTALAEVTGIDGPPELSVTCGQAPLTGLPPDLDALAPLDDEARSALEAARTGRASLEAAPFVEGYEWSIADRTEERMILLGRSSDPTDLASMGFERVSDGSWDVAGFGGCRIQVSAVGFGPARAAFDPERQPDPTSTELPLQIIEMACAGGQAPDGREIVPVVTETATAVEVIVLVEGVVGGASCPGNPPVSITVELDEPLGDRVVLDGSIQPSIERTWPPSPTDLYG
ncbi:MAG: hypothetical protein AAGF02_07205 [Actinomycetota bacterium]